MEKSYTIPAETRIGHVHLKVSDLQRSLTFYRDLLGFEVTQYYGQQTAFISAGGYHHHIGLNTWHSKGASKADSRGVELYWDKPNEQWPLKEDGSIDMFTRPLDLENLLLELQH